ncbi:hypothetical protein ABFX02_10G092400 [Erythranthe guttata]
MSRFPEISSLFGALASNLQTQHPAAENEVDHSLYVLNRSLNLSEAPRVRVLETALSLMSFTAPQVYESAIEFTVKTLVAVLSSSIECKVLKINSYRVLKVGGLIPGRDCGSVVEMCADILGKFDGHNKGNLSALLLHNVIRVAALAPCSPHALPSTSDVDMEFDDSSTSALANLVGHLTNEFTVKNGEIPSRLMLWHLDPMMLKQDLSQILQEIVERPFLCLSMEIYNRIEWRSKLICIAISPSIFAETRALLHKWFLMTGLASVMEFLTVLVGQVLDIISRPMWWGISMEVGSKLPFSHAYFPYDHDLLRILAAPVSLEYFQCLLCKISGSISTAGVHSHSSPLRTAIKISTVDHKSMWSMVVNFPDWFFYASILLFCDSIPADNLGSGTFPTSVKLKSRLMHDSEVACPSGAAKFIAWFLNPMNESSQSLTVDYLVKVSDLWTLKCSCPNKGTEVKRVPKEKTSRLKLLHNKKGITPQELDSSAVFIWLKEFEDTYIKIFKTSGVSSSNAKGFSFHRNLFLRKVPLGILLLCPNRLNLAGCSLLLHYAATGSIVKLSDMQNSGKGKKVPNYYWQGDSLIWIEHYTKTEAIAGCRIVFDITDVAESISPSMFETEEEGVNFICQLKSKSWDYLFQCIKRLLEIKIDGDGAHMQKDLLARVMRWRHQGKDVFENNKDMDFVCNTLDV